MRSFLASLVVLLAIGWIVAAAIGLYAEQGLVALLTSQSQFIFLALFIVGGALLLARRLDREGFEDLWIVRMTFWLLPFLREILQSKHGDHVSKTREEREADARRLRILRRFLSAFGYVVIGVGVYFCVVWLMGWQFHFIHKKVAACEQAHLNEAENAHRICSEILTEADALLPLAHADKLMHPDAFWIGRTELVLLSDRPKCEVLEFVTDSLARVQDPDRFEKYEPLAQVQRSLQKRDGLQCSNENALEKTHQKLRDMEQLFEN